MDIKPVLIAFLAVIAVGAEPPAGTGPGSGTPSIPERDLIDTAAIYPDYEILVIDKPISKDATHRPTVVAGEQIRSTERTTALEALSQESADIYVSSRGAGLHGVSSGASGGIYIRGLGGSPNSQILVVEDGAPDYMGIFGHPIPDAFSPALIDRVLVIKGGDGVLYGTNAMGGIIAIENKWPGNNGVSLDHDAAYGTFNTFRDRISLFCKNGAIDAVGGFSSFSTDGHRDGASGSSTAGQIGVRFHLGQSATLSLRDKAIHLNGGDPGPAFHPYTDRWFEVLRNTFTGRLKMSLIDWNLSVVPWFNFGEHRLYDGFFSRDYTAGTTVEATRSFLDSKIELLLGAGGDHIDGLVTNRITDETETVKPMSGGSAYSQLSVSPKPGLTLVGGVRAYYSTRYGYVPLYKAGIAWGVFQLLTLHSRITRNFRQPTLRELYLPYPTANPGLKPEHATNWDAGIELSPRFLHLSCSVYKTWAQNLIKYFGMWPSAEVVNIDQMEISGIEGELELKAWNPFRFFLTGCWQNVGRFTKQNPGAKANVRGEWSRTMAHGVLVCAVSGEWVHDIYMNNYCRDQLDDVLVFDGSLRYKAVSPSDITVEPYVLVRNLLDSQYEYIKYYSMPGLHFLAGLRLGI
ncbi:MAG: hypothetical protein A2268_14580 [Candidatus Raymondbacteria bacterium RifOxyA12_full_50_37]|uniref:TonB-dependent receptor plug domain-containing protein n=1 Tax=Candidatus Raymondbacteria bacterium RIFOXYD12_FULL_49_13 TaxID=1817890 RepID=A0A1F7F2Q5_UNCRA|nr:MAG: hypothetical protein A2268_14580 [Candidatus Raymondbacteria bacterium RifOxyA12_full_50_37]OGJ88645.1 MAG: hypothetical protein A2248_20515 [Candidatus Raymondbacteria bacterium RIFOXYA2_FULL_49_16]OGJ90503.1 MAG: hypothetical protein A2350_18635 [Candidatus Raymondbacteria bacterium RifOxyB12_full_50_8]OGK00817.1 MAG: hypothetical protein A2519_07770 [Candidatus Raymondbacteria bacterium RIFOXYD12_FULL_49_13]OGK02880.1 MAG: hypothetical protein A2487_17795 [Candidatus Raymondbacteria 